MLNYEIQIGCPPHVDVITFQLQQNLKAWKLFIVNLKVGSQYIMQRSPWHITLTTIIKSCTKMFFIYANLMKACIDSNKKHSATKCKQNLKVTYVFMQFNMACWLARLSKVISTKNIYSFPSFVWQGINVTLPLIPTWDVFVAINARQWQIA